VMARPEQIDRNACGRPLGRYGDPSTRFRVRMLIRAAHAGLSVRPALSNGTLP
jgi:hypothetical protein